MDAHSANASASPLLKVCFRVAAAWARAILSNPPNSRTRDTWQKRWRGNQNILFIHYTYRGVLRLARFDQNFESREIQDPLQPITPKIS